MYTVHVVFQLVKSWPKASVCNFFRMRFIATFSQVVPSTIFSFQCQNWNVEEFFLNFIYCNFLQTLNTNAHKMRFWIWKLYFFIIDVPYLNLLYYNCINKRQIFQVFLSWKCEYLRFTYYYCWQSHWCIFLAVAFTLANALTAARAGAVARALYFLLFLRLRILFAVTSVASSTSANAVLSFLRLLRYCCR